jgi:hypothetical protein
MYKNLRFRVLGLLFALCPIVLQAQNTDIVREANETLTGVKSITIDGQFCKIELLPSENDDVAFTAKLVSDKHDEAYEIANKLENGQLTIAIKYPAQGWTTHSGEILLKIPQNIAVDIVSTSGSVKMAELQNITIKTNSRSGFMDVANCQGTITLETITGYIKLTNCSGELSTKTKSGVQTISNATGIITANSTEGEINLSNTSGTLKTESTSGNQNIVVHQGDVNAKAINGFVKINETKGNITVVTFAGSQKLFKTTGLVNLQATTGELLGTRIMLTGSSSFKTTEGKIKLQIDNKTDEVTFALKSVNSFIQARGTSKKKALKLGKGPIVITGESTTGGQVYN